jgi:fructuronate reductase
MYTAGAADGADWGIAAFSGRSAALARELSEQDGLYTLITRATDGDRFELVNGLSACHSAADHQQYLNYLSSDEVKLLTLTVTEAAYLDVEHLDVQADLAQLRADRGAAVRTVPAKLVAGLSARRGTGPLTVVSCDNLSENGDTTARVVGRLAEALEPALAQWITQHVSFVNTVVDRITPRTTQSDLLLVSDRGDHAPVVTEPFSEWILSGQFPAGRPDWESAGAVFADDVVPFEHRKLWLLNGAHSLLAYAGALRGHDTVADAVGDESCRDWIEQWWREACAHLPLPASDLAQYRAALLTRFANPRIRHQLAQIAADGSQKLPVRVLPVLRAERAAERMPVGANRILAGWLCHLRGGGVPVTDPASAQLAELATGPLDAAARKVLSFLDPVLGEDDDLVAVVGQTASSLIVGA